jgi:hypothetical protein
MGKYQNGINGPFRGKIGSVTGSSWNGIDYMKGHPNVNKSRKPSDAQQKQRDKFTVASTFMKSMKEVILFGFNAGTAGQSVYSSASAYLIKNALDTTTKPYRISYSDVLVTRGEYPGAKNPTAIAGESGQITFNWKNSTGIGAAKATDIVLLFIYSPAQNKFIYRDNVATRSMETATLHIDVFKGETVETYISVLKADKSEVSPSLYAGEVTMTA